MSMAHLMFALGTTQWQPHQTGVTALRFHPSGRALVSTAADGTIRLWDLEAIRAELAALELDW